MVSGLIGFNYDPAAMEWTGLETGVHYLDTLYDQDIIAEKIFGVALQGESSTSYFDVGFYDTNAYVGEPAWIPVEDDYYYAQWYWGSELTGFRYRDQVTDSVTYADSVDQAVSVSLYTDVIDYVLGYTSTSESCLVLPYTFYEWAVPYLVENYLSYYEYDYSWGYIFDCSEIASIPTIDLLFGGYWMEMLVDDYVINLDGTTCALCIQ